MNDVSLKPKAVFWIISVLLLIWGLIGAGMYLAEMMMDDSAYASAFSQDAADLRRLVPAWSIAGYAIGVWSGLLGTIFLLMRKRWAVTAYYISLIGALIAWSWHAFSPKAADLMNTQGGWFMMSLVFALCLFSLWYARRQKARGILR